MAATPPLPPFPATSTKSLKQHKPYHSPLLLSSNNRSNFITSCEIRRSFENHRNWTIEHFSNNRDSIHSNNSNSFSSSLVSATASQLPMKNSKKVVLFYSAETKSLAYNIASESDAIELRSISWGFVSFLDTKFLFQFFNQCGSLFSFFINFKRSFLLFEYPFS
jgi:hypothetical protein